MPLKELYYFAIYKPFGTLSQFTDKLGRKTLADLYDFPHEVYPVGRLDADSEGLLLLTNDKKLTDNLLNPANKHEREYYVQVEGIPEEKDLQKLRAGILLKDFKTLPAKVKPIPEPNFPERKPPIRERKNIPVSWLKIIIVEGKNRQVRKMTASIGYPTLRLIRARIKNIKLGYLKPGEIRKLNHEEIKELKG